MEIKILLENDNILNEHGLSIYLKYKDLNILFDTAQSDLFIKNAKKLGIDLSKTDYIILSHGHYDHGNGLKYLDIGKKPLICHPDVFLKRFKDENKYIGLNQSKSELSEKFNLILSNKPYFINKDICFLGQINSRKTKYRLENGDIDYIKDDTALVINTKKGLVIITGCSHSGIKNIIEYAKKVMNNNNIYAIIGGFHLKKVNAEVKSLIKEFENVDKIYTGHCTKNEVINYLKNKGLNIHSLKSLLKIEI
ncbi:MAG: MBL fold metallo-hydrolase [Bacillota bacterium]